jgi:hypothetical protein
MALEATMSDPGPRDHVSRVVRYIYRTTIRLAGRCTVLSSKKPEYTYVGTDTYKQHICEWMDT